MSGQQRRYEIRGRDGTTLHSGAAPGFRRFVEQLAEARASFAGADLRGAPLQHLALDGLDFTGADLSGADMTGASVCKARFEGASMRGIRADGLRARYARLKGADLSPLEAPADADGDEQPARPSVLRGADLDAADLRRAVLDGADLGGSTLVAANLSAATARRASFREARMSNAEHALARYLSCDFDGADLSSRTGAPEGSQPDRTAQAVCVDNSYKDAAMDVGVPAFRRDRRAGKLMKLAALGVSAAAVAGMATLVPEGVSEVLFEGWFGHGIMVVAAVKLVSFLREKIEEASRERVGKAVAGVLRAGKSYLHRVVGRGADVRGLVAATVSGPGIEVLKAALDRSAGSFPEAGHDSAPAGGGTSVFFCDRRHLAQALRTLHVERTRGPHLDRDILMVRKVGESSPASPNWFPAPAALRLVAGGGMAATWSVAGRVASASWDADGTLLASRGFWEAPPGMDAAKAAFEVALWSDHGLRRPYVTSTHQIAAGRDGSIQVVNEQTGRLNNAWGPALITMDDEELHYRHGEMVPAR